MSTAPAKPETARYLQVYRASVPEANVERLLEIRGDAIAEAQRLCPHLLDAELIRLNDETWLDILTWDRPNGEEALMAQAEHFSVLTEMHGLLVDVTGPDLGVIVHSTRP